MFSQDTIEKIKNHTDIVELISQYMNLKKSGGQHKGLCPFHNEKTASFSVSPEKQVFHCFGCGVGGTVFNFIMKAEHLAFQEAVKFLAERAKIPLSEVGASPAEQKAYDEKQTLYKLHERAVSFYSDMLLNDPSAQGARNYLKQRSCDSKLTESFYLGFAPAQGHKFLQYALEQGFSMELLQKSGLIVRNQYDQEWRDAFRGRLLFPIFNSMGKVVAFGGRVLDDGLPKYLNSPETPIYTKGQELYGLAQAKESIQRQGCALVVEGYFDAMTCHQYGFTWAVATLGTALTEGQIRLLKRYTQNIVFIYDGDQAGITAAKRSGALVMESSLRPKFVLLKEVKDPDEFLKKFSPEAFSEKVKGAISLTDFHVQLALEQNATPDFDEKLKIVDSIMPFLEKIENLIEQRHYLKSLSDSLRLEEGVLADELKRRVSKSQGGSAKAPVDASVQSRASAEEEMILFLLKYPQQAGKIFSRLSGVDFMHPLCQKVALQMEKELQENGRVETSRILSALEGEDDFLRKISKSLVEEENKYADIEKATEDFVATLQEKTQRKKITGLKVMISEAEKQGKQEELKQLLVDYQQLLRMRN